MPIMSDKLPAAAPSKNWENKSPSWCTPGIPAFNKPVFGCPTLDVSPPSYWKTMGHPCGAVGRSPMKFPRAGQSTTKTCTRPILQFAFYVNID